MNPNNTNNTQNNALLDGICRRGVLVATSVRYWRGCKRLNPEDLGLDPAHVSDRLIQLGHKRLIPRDALQAFALIESRVQATVESSSFPLLGGIGRFVPNPRLGDLTDTGRPPAAVGRRQTLPQRVRCRLPLDPPGLGI